MKQPTNVSTASRIVVVLTMLATTLTLLVVNANPASAGQSAEGFQRCYHGRRVAVEDRTIGFVNVRAPRVNRFYTAVVPATHRTRSPAFEGRWTVDANDLPAIEGLIVEAFGYCYF